MTAIVRDREELLDLLKNRSVRRGDFVLASGKRADLYVDARITTMSGRGQALIGRVALAALADAGIEPDLVGGLTMGADPVAYAIAHAAALAGRAIDAFSVRKEAKGHGTDRLIEGPFRSGNSVVVVEDVITSGGSALKAVDSVRQAGGSVLAVLTLLDRQEGGRERIQAADLPVVALYTKSELLGTR